MCQPGRPAPPRVAVVAEQASLGDAARKLAAGLGLPMDGILPSGPPVGDDAGRAELLLVLTSARLELRAARPPRRRPVAVDWAGPISDALRRPGAARSLPLARAVGACRRDRVVLDATAGLGRDAFRLAGLGATVVAAERSPILAALLADGRRRARADPVLGELIGDRLGLHDGDARELLARPPAPHVVLIDPMYPDAGRSALPRGELQVLRRLLGPDDDADALLAAALAVARERVVVKRHVRDPTLGRSRPSHRVVGRSTRFDVYVTGSARTDA